jgi:predicted metalloprotease with PDZ domain
MMFCTMKLHWDYFLHIEHVFGQEAIKEIISEIPNLKKANGSALIALVNNKINADVEMLAENFRFPETGMETDIVIPLEGARIYEDGAKVINVEPNGAAEQAGIQIGDFITKMNNIDIRTNLDYELALYNLMDVNKVQIELVRDKIHIVTEMHIAFSSVST